ncbi:MAG: hypothetical protein ACRDPA_34580 [Solirubrobacteraceae bacterium]
MDHHPLVARVLREVAGARAAITASYQRLWHQANPHAPDAEDAETGDQTPRKPATDDEHRFREADSG